ncbi:MAG: 2-oxo acid dehydrogenase subunit E2 [Ruminococcaceae bacterium]|jgi:pyruvate dehydrogenase E2 component (dihydrolipoamide acetyltransferase)|nr:2-oxo acid dehydrogenase subunit E2 [Oscillospiraceae bacterium]
MATPVIMPRQGQSVESCIIGQWHKGKGDPVQTGDILFTYETDKATFDETAKVDGTLLEIYFEEGDDVPVLTNVCVIGEPGEDTSEFAPEGGTAAEAAAEQTAEQPVTLEEARPAEKQADSTQSAGGQSGAISPRARNLAEKSNADLRQAVASGPKGRIIERDVRQLIDSGKLATGAAGTYPVATEGTAIGGRVGVQDVQAGQATPDTTAIPQAQPATAGPDTWTEKHSNIRKVIARSMHASLASMAQLTLNSSFDCSDILALRKKLKQAASSGLTAEQGFSLAESVPTINDILLYAVARVLPRHPACNAHYDDEKMTYFKHVHLGVAIDTPRGLMVPTLTDADTRPLADISVQVKELSAACQKGTISPDLLKGGTFTVTNLGTLDIESFTPVINPPQTCILGVNTIVTRVREVDGELITYPAMGLSLTFDHRAVDGAPAARFLKDLKQVLENFSLLLMQ